LNFRSWNQEFSGYGRELSKLGILEFVKQETHQHHRANFSPLCHAFFNGNKAYAIAQFKQAYKRKAGRNLFVLILVTRCTETYQFEIPWKKNVSNTSEPINQRSDSEFRVYKIPHSVVIASNNIKHVIFQHTSSRKSGKQIQQGCLTDDVMAERGKSFTGSSMPDRMGKFLVKGLRQHTPYSNSVE